MSKSKNPHWNDDLVTRMQMKGIDGFERHHLLSLFMLDSYMCDLYCQYKRYDEWEEAKSNLHIYLDFYI